jgi:hypothetical protein
MSLFYVYEVNIFYFDAKFLHYGTDSSRGLLGCDMVCYSNSTQRTYLTYLLIYLLHGAEYYFIS